MRRLLLLCLLSISLAAASVPLPQDGAGEAIPLLQEGLGEAPSRYSAFIETPKASVSGILVLATVDGEVRGSLFNEFGLTALSFTYQPAPPKGKHAWPKGKVRLHTVLPMFDHWYVRSILRRDLRHLMETHLEDYTNPKYHIHYSFSPLPPEAP